MAEIHLPTKATQDSIKTDTSAILSNFPISGGTDFLGGTLSVVGRNATITGKGVAIFGKGQTYDGEITIDGVHKLKILLSGSPLIYPFQTSLTTDKNTREVVVILM